jgi:membrane protease YdiL (CAAX protease family)
MLVSVTLIFPFIEEIGLRGYWLDRLQTGFTALSASLILGVVWAFWHMPLFFMEGYYSEVTFNPELVPFVVSIILGSVIVTWVYNNI